jgi:hypothetical protein
MWGKLALISKQVEDKNSAVVIPQAIELDISKTTHFIGRIPNPGNSVGFNNNLLD